MKENRFKVVSPGFTNLLYLTMMHQRMQKMCFIRVGHTRKSQIAVIVQASGRNNISSTVPAYFDKLRTYEMCNLQKYTNNPRLHPKMIGF